MPVSRLVSQECDELVPDDAPPLHLVREVPFTATGTAGADGLRRVTLSRTDTEVVSAHRTGDESTLVLRRGSSDDVAMLVAMHTRCSGETIRRRYHAPIPYLSPRLAHALLAPEGGHSIVMTTTETTMAGIITLAPDHDGDHEMGLLVEDRWQRRGIGSRLLRTLADHAVHRGVTRLTCYVQPDNQPLLATLRRAGFKPRISMVDGVLRADIALTRLRRPAGRPTAQRDQTGAMFFL
jgi:ribosomal protein S18 acetylase RimI-like enzyme